ncbi:MAG: nucleotidyltransferase family protein [Clostridiales bacterium]|nr:nucleotidyltransferase family protein [Clostridiales bacterium]
MRIIGVIAEYNPFHGGHLYQLREIRRRYGAQYIVIAMSGDFVQRGEPAIYDKYVRTAIALHTGADLVLELPVCFATAGAEDFAAAGVSLFDHLGIVNGLCFGSETGDLAPLAEAADILLSEPSAFQDILKNCLRSGDSYPKAQSQALAAVLAAEPTMVSDPERSMSTDLLSDAPNNILGIEYLKALRRRGSHITPLTIRRAGQDYHETDLFAAGGFPSAAALRKAIFSGEIDYFHDVISDLSQYSPATGGLPSRNISGIGDLTSGIGDLTPIFPEDLTGILNAKLLALSENHADLTDFADFPPELASRLARRILDFASFQGRVEQLKTKSFTYARISRALLHLILGITRDDVALAKKLNYTPYVRILGFRRSSAPLLTDLKHSCDLPLITKTADARTCLDTDGLKIFEKDLFASHLYQSLLFAKSGKRMPNEYTKSVIVI